MTRGEAERGTNQDDLRYTRERKFHDERFADDDRPANRFYWISEPANAHRSMLLDAAPAGAEFLEYGCGAAASSALHLAQQGRRVSAIDISSVAVAEAKAEAQAQGLGDRIDVREMNAERLEFADGSFDVVCGTGVLHHLDLNRAFGEIARVLRPAGRAVFIEPFGHNPLINAYRRRTPDQRTPDEHPLLMKDLGLAGRYFRSVETTHFALTSLLALPVAGSRAGPRLLSWLDAADGFLFRHVPVTRRMSWLGVLELVDPRTDCDDLGGDQPEMRPKSDGTP